MRKEVEGLRKEQKENVVSWIKEHTAADETVVFAGFKGLKVAEADLLRNKLRDSGSVYRVVKNTLIRIGLDGKEGSAELGAILTGTTAVAIAVDPVALAKVLKAFAKEHEALIIKGALFSGQLLSATDAMKLADLPSREQLLGQLVGMLMQPLTQLAGVLSAPLRDLASVLNQVKKAKEG